MKEAQYKFSDFPIKYELEDYDRARDRYVRRIAKIADVKAIYQVGNISSAGISDIDLAIVVSDKLLQSSFKDYSLEAGDEKLRYLFMHNPIMLNKKLWREFSLFPFAEHLKPLFARDKTSALKELSDIEKTARRISDIIDNMGSHLRFFSFVVASQYCPVRSVLIKLNALAINIRDFKNITSIIKDKWEAFARDITNLRREWFLLKEPEQKKRLLSFLNISLFLSYDLVFHLAEHLVEKKYISRFSLKPLLASQDSIRFSIFLDNTRRNIVDIHRKIINFLNGSEKRNRIIPTLLPLAFYAQWTYYRSVKGEFSKTFNKYFLSNNGIGNVVRDPVYKNILFKRIQLLNRQADFLKRNKFYYGLLLQPPLKPSFYGAKRRNIKRIIRYADKKFLGISNRYKLTKILKEI